MVSHSRDEIYRFADELIIMGRGKVEVQGGVREVFRDPHTNAAAIPRAWLFTSSCAA
jgi:molybdate transport system ATP-binding protein